MTGEIEYILSRFDGLFAPWKGRRMVLHGSREYARAILDRFDAAYGFEAVATSELPAGSEFCGKPVVADADLAELHPDIIIMTERVRHAEAVYQAIGRMCAAEGIALRDMYGLDWLAVRAEIDAQEPLLLKGWLDLAQPYDVISFEVPDCLIQERVDIEHGGMEKVVRPAFKRLIEHETGQGKSIVYIGRGPYSAESQRGLLEQFGLLGEDGGEFFMRAGEDGCWHEICSRHPGKRILHIGHGIPREGILPRYYGADTYRVFYANPDRPREDEPRARGAVPVAGDDAGRALADEIVHAIDDCEVVSFDVFETLAIRQTSDPGDVFALVEERARAAGIPAQGFAAARQQAQVAERNPDLHGIYERVGEALDLTAGQAAWLMDRELETERAVIMRRESVFQLFRYALEAGKRVVLVSDMYLPRGYLDELLEFLGIVGYERLYVSCEEGRLKQDGLLEKVASLCGEAAGAVHLGDSWERDVEPADALGMRAVRIPPVQETARRCGFADALDRAESLPERIMVGSCIARAFDDPFGPPPSDDVRERLFSHLSLAPVLIGYLTWLFRQAPGKALDGILFAARDGWLPIQVYRTAAERHPSWSLPQATYFYTSRRAAFIPCSSEPRQMRLLDEKIRYDEPGHDPEQLLSAFTGLPEEAVKPYEPGSSLEAYLESHREALARNAGEYAARYGAYLERALVDGGRGRYGFVDFMSVGTCQDYLGQWAPFALHGLYFGRRDVDDRLDADFDSYFTEETNSAYLFANYLVLERYMTSPEPSLDDFTDGGDPVFADEVRDGRTLDAIARVHGKVLDQANWFFGLFDEPPATISSVLAARMYELGGSFGMDGEDFDDWGKYNI